MKHDSWLYLFVLAAAAVIYWYVRYYVLPKNAARDAQVEASLILQQRKGIVT